MFPQSKFALWFLYLSIAINTAVILFSIYMEYFK